MTGNETQPCANCGGLVKFNIDEGCWLHVRRATVNTIMWGRRECPSRFARPTTPIEGVDY